MTTSKPGSLSDPQARLADGTSDMLSVMDTGFRLLAVNRPYARLFGKEDPAELVGMTVEQAFAHEPLHYRNVIAPLLQACLQGTEQFYEQWVNVPGLGRSYFEVHYMPVRDADGAVAGIATVARDRTEIVRTIEALQQSERMLKRTQHIAKLGGWTFDVATGETRWTDEMYEIHEVGRDFVPTQENLESFITPEEIVRVRQELALALSGKETSIISHMTSAGGVHKWVRSLAFPVLADGKVVSLDGMLQDVTDIIEMQSGMNRALHLLENQKYVLDQHAIVTVTDAAGHITHVNQQFIDVAGYTREELLGRNHRLLKSGMHGPEFYRDIWQTITAGHVWRGEICNRSRNGSLFWMHTTIVPLRGESGAIEEYVAVRADITQLKHAEARLRRAQKMDAIGQLSGGIAHDFNNLLGIVIGNVELAELQMPIDHAARLPLQNARNAAMRGSVLTRRLLNFSRQAPVSGSLLDINQVLTGLEVLISKSLTALVTVEMRLGDELGLVQVHAGDLEDAIINLAINAGDAMPQGGKLEFVTRHLVLTQPEFRNGVELGAGTWVELSVIDNGIGMTRDTMEKIFEPYFTTKSGNKGTGLGLAMVYGFVQRSRGQIGVESEPGHGTRFSMFLPVAAPAGSLGDKPAAQAAEPLAAKPGETILLVDDEEAIVQVSSLHLRNLGYVVLGATSPEAALDILLGPDRIDLLFTDIVMPGGVNGIELAERALALRPALKVLLTSGYARVKDQKAMDRWADNLLAKPYGSTELSRKIRQLLDG